MRDRAATKNGALKVLYPNCVDIGCFSHTLDHVGEKFQTPVLEEILFQPGLVSFHTVLKTKLFGMSRLESQWRALVLPDGGVVGK